MCLHTKSVERVSRSRSLSEAVVGASTLKPRYTHTADIEAWSSLKFFSILPTSTSTASTVSTQTGGSDLSDHRIRAGEKQIARRLRVFERARGAGGERRRRSLAILRGVGRVARGREHLGLLAAARRLRLPRPRRAKPAKRRQRKHARVGARETSSRPSSTTGQSPFRFFFIVLAALAFCISSTWRAALVLPCRSCRVESALSAALHLVRGKLSQRLCVSPDRSDVDDRFCSHTSRGRPHTHTHTHV